jgi:hypothetical protein
MQWRDGTGSTALVSASTDAVDDLRPAPVSSPSPMTRITGSVPERAHDQPGPLFLVITTSSLHRRFLNFFLVAFDQVRVGLPRPLLNPESHGSFFSIPSVTVSVVVSTVARLNVTPSPSTSD